jgi:hypothetical protein
VIGEHLPDLEKATSTKRTCSLLGASRATAYRRHPDLFAIASPAKSGPRCDQ